MLRYWGKRRQSLEDRCEGTFQTHVHMVNDGRSSKNAGQSMHNGVKIDLNELFSLWRHGSVVVVLRQRGQEEFLRSIL